VHAPPRLDAGSCLLLLVQLPPRQMPAHAGLDAGRCSVLPQQPPGCQPPVVALQRDCGSTPLLGLQADGMACPRAAAWMVRAAARSCR
jgi:hypothetical protein